MTPLILAIFAALALFSSFLAGVFGIAGGIILMGGLLMLVPVADAMVLHGATQTVSNGWRAVLWRRYILWGVVLRYSLGLLVAGAIFFSLELVPDQRVIFLLLGIAPFMGRILPARFVPQVGRRWGAELCGFVCTVFQLLSGVSGPLLDVFFVRSDIDRRAVIATKSACQVVTHLAKLAYFGVLVGGMGAVSLDPLVLTVAVSMAMLGTSLARPVLERLTDANFRTWTMWLVMAVGVVFLIRGIWGFL